MRKEVSPWVAVVGILLTLAAIQFIYWRGLVAQKTLRLPRGGGGGALAPAAANEESGPVVTTLAGRPSPGHRDGTSQQARFSGPAGLAVDAAGAIYVADSRNHCIRKISTDGNVNTFAGTNVEGFADGARGSVRFSAPAAVVVSPAGDLYVADTGNHRIRRLTKSGVVATYAGSHTPRDDLGRPIGGYRDGAAREAQFRYPVGLAVDAAGTLYVADAGNHCVRRISTSGQVTTLPVVGARMESPTELALVEDRLWVADTGKSALLVGPRNGPLQPWQPARNGKAPKSPSGVVAAGGNLYVADSSDHCLYQLADDRLSGVVGKAGESGCTDGRGAGARFAFPAGLAVGPSGDLYLADFGNNCIRKVKLKNGSGEVR